MARITYIPEKVVDEPDESLSLLAISQRHSIPHISACGGMAQCSTCRVLVLDGAANLSAPLEKEQKLAALKGFEPCIRLACQARAHGPVTIRRLVLDDRDTELAELDTPQPATGKEAMLAVLFSDIRNFTPFAERNLPYDVVHILNRYFQAMGDAVLQHEGHIDKYMGDGLLAWFGLQSGDLQQACRQAARAALGMLQSLPDLNRYLERHFATNLRIGIGIHAGAVIVAELGHPKLRHKTVIGETVNVASRVEAANKDLGTSILLTREVAQGLPPESKFGRTARLILKGTSSERELVELIDCPL